MNGAPSEQEARAAIISLLDEGFDGEEFVSALDAYRAAILASREVEADARLADLDTIQALTGASNSAEAVLAVRKMAGRRAMQSAPIAAPAEEGEENAGEGGDR